MAIIKLKKGFSGVTPTGLTLAEPAFDYKDNKLYVGVTASAIWVGGEVDNSTALGTSQIKIPTQYAVKTYIDSLGLSPGVVVTGVNGVTGAVTLGVTAGPGLSIVNPTGSGKGITLINTGVLSVNGSTGAVTNIAVTNAAQSFSGIQTFTNGITVSAASTFTGIQRFSDIRNRTSGTTLTIQTDDAGTAGFGADIAISAIGNIRLSPTPLTSVGGSSPQLYIEGKDDATGRFIFSGGDIVVGSQSTFISGGRNSNVIFSVVTGTGSINLRGITSTSANQTILLPDHSGIVVVPSNLGTSGFILKANGITAQPTWVNANSAGFTAYAAQEVIGGAAGNLLYQSAIDTTSFVTNAGTTGFFLTYNTTSNTPTWVNPNTIGFTAYGSTVSVNLQGGAAGSLPYNTAANTTTFLTIGSANTILRSTGSAPTWVNPNAAGFTAYHAQELVGGAAGNLVYQSGVGNSSFVTNSGTTGFFLTYNTTTNTPTWVNPNTIGFTAYGSTVSVNLQGGAAGSLPYNTAANTTGFLTIGSAGTILTSTGSAPQWSTATGLTVGTAQNISVTSETADTTNYLIFVNSNTNSNQPVEYNSSLVYNAVNNFLEANIDGGLF